MKKKLRIVAAAVVCLTLAISACGQKKEDEPVSAPVEQEEASIAVETQIVKKTAIRSEFTYSGKMKPIEQMNVASMVSGKVASVSFDIGDYVKAGDVLFKMDTTDIQNNLNVLRASLQTAQANVESAETSLELVNGASMQSQIENAKSALANAEVTLNNIKVTYDNNKQLYEAGIISKTDFDATEKGYEQAKISYEQAKTSYDLLANQMPEENRRKAEDGLKIAQANVASVQAQIKSAQKSLNDAVVTSPLSGVVTACNVKAGELLSAQSVPFTIMDMSKVHLEVNVSEQAINRIHVGDSVDVKVPSIGADMRKGVIATINPAADANGAYAVKVEMDNADGIFKSGMFAEVHFINEKNDSAIVVPRNALLESNGETYVYINDNGAAKKVNVETGIDNGSELEIKSGLNENDELVINGQAYLIEGNKLKVVSDIPQAQTNSSDVLDTDDKEQNNKENDDRNEDASGQKEE